MQKVQISERSLVRRIRRALKKEERTIRSCRFPSKSWPSLGDWYVVDVNANFVVETHCNLIELAKRLEVMAEFEELEDESGDN